MRLKLDKLFLSAGLALAVIATTIPVGAGTTTTSNTVSGLTLVSDGSVVESTNATFLNALTGVKVGETTETGLTKTVETSVTGLSTSDVTVQDLSSQLKAKLGTTQTYVAGTKFADSQYTVTEKYVFSGYQYTTTEAISATDSTAADAAEKALKEEIPNILASLGLEANSAKGISIAKNTELELQANSASYYTSTEDTTAGTFTSTIAAGQVITVTAGKYTKTTVTTVDTLPSGYTYDLVFTDSHYVANKKYTIYKDVTETNGNHTISEVEGKSIADGQLLYTTTDLSTNVAYVLVSEEVSIADNLIFDETDTATVAEINQLAEPTDEGKTGIAECIESNSFTPVSYFTIDLVSRKTYSDTPITFKIAVPVDVDSNVTYKVLRFHEGNVDILDTTVTDGYIYFTTDKFSDYALVTVAADTAEDPTENPTEEEKQPDSTTPDSPSTPDNSKKSDSASAKTADNSMMPLFMTTLLLALCAGSLAIYKEKKTN